jgi:hypothetical protein
MNENIHRAQVTINAMKMLIRALDDVGQHLTVNPKLYAYLSESPIEDLRRMCNELDELLDPLKHDAPALASPTSIIEQPISSPASPGPIESTS